MLHLVNLLIFSLFNGNFKITAPPRESQSNDVEMSSCGPYPMSVRSNGMRFLHIEDMLISEAHKPDLFKKYCGDSSDKMASRRKRALAGRGENGLWPLPQSIYYDANSAGHGVFNEAFQHIEKHTCLHFKRCYYCNGNYIKFELGGSACHSSVGFSPWSSSPHTITLGSSCIQKGTILHELGHALGLHHEHNRPDRDFYIQVHQDRVIVGQEFQLNRFSWETVDDYDIPYDYLSITHYAENTFAASDKLITIETRDPRYQKLIGQRIGYSFRDIKMLNLMYGCSASCPKEKNITCPGEAFLDSNCRCVCPGPDLYQPARHCTDGDTGELPSPFRTTTTAQPTTSAHNSKDTVDGKPISTTLCYDNFTLHHCQWLKRSGGCINMSTSMRIFCRKTCGFCSTLRATGSAGPISSEVMDSKNKSALKEPITMATTTEIAVTQLDEQCKDELPEVCNEVRHRCTAKIYAEKMPKFCRLTCGYCTPPPSTETTSVMTPTTLARTRTTTSIVNCVDQSSRCEKDAKKGFCRQFPNYYKKICPRTCRFC